LERDSTLGWVYLSGSGTAPAPGAAASHRDIRLRPHQGMRGKCSQCQQPAPGYDRLEERSWLHVPLWGIPSYFFYAPRRVECPEHGIVVEEIPWSEGKRPVTQTMMVPWDTFSRAFRIPPGFRLSSHFKR